MDNISIRYAVKEDAKTIAEIEKKYIVPPWSEKLIEEEICKENCIFLTALIGDKVIGYISGDNIVGEVYINNIAVSEEYRRLHVGEKLMTALIKSAFSLHCSLITLEVRKSNIPARSLYEKCGFSLCGERKDYYSFPRENAVIYTLYSETDGQNENTCH